MNWNASNVVLTHSSGLLTLGTGDLRITTAGTNAASVVTVGGTQTLTNKTLTSPTLTTPALGTPASWADVVAANTERLLLVRANVPLASGAVRVLVVAVEILAAESIKSFVASELLDTNAAASENGGDDVIVNADCAILV